MARDGLGITRQPDWLVATDLREGRLVSILDEFTAPLTLDAPGIYAIVQRRRYRSAKVDAFLEFVKSVIGHVDSAGDVRVSMKKPGAIGSADRIRRKADEGEY
jgi:DNA-binding transcriptional LysR family regulator